MWFHSYVESSEQNKLIKIELPYDPTISFLGIYPRNPNTNSNGYIHPYVHCNIVHGGQDMETTKVCFNRWLDKEVVYLHNGILLSHKKEEILPFVTA